MYTTLNIHSFGSHGGPDRMVIGSNQCLSPLSSEFKSCSWRGVLDTTLCDTVWQAGRVFFLGTPVSSTNKLIAQI